MHVVGGWLSVVGSGVSEDIPICLEDGPYFHGLGPSNSLSPHASPPLKKDHWLGLKGKAGLGVGVPHIHSREQCHPHQEIPLNPLATHVRPHAHSVPPSHACLWLETRWTPAIYNEKGETGWGGAGGG